MMPAQQKHVWLIKLTHSSQDCNLAD